MAAGGGPPVKNDVKIADFVKVHLKIVNFSWRASRALYIYILNFCHRRAQYFLGLDFKLTLRGPPPRPRTWAPGPPPRRTGPVHDSPLKKNLVLKERIGREGNDFSPSA